MNFWKALVALIIYGLVAWGLSSLANFLLNTPSDIAFAGGAVLWIGIVAGSLWLLPKFIKLCRGGADAYKQNMKSNGLMTLMIFVTALGAMTTSGCTRIGPGHVGIVVDMAGSQKGVHDYPVQTGWVFYSPIGTSVYEYPTYMQTAIWTKSPTEGKGSDNGNGTNDEIIFNSKEGNVITADINLSYQIDADKVPAFYVKFRNDDLSTFTHGYLHNLARDEFVEAASTYTVEEIYGVKKEEFVNRVKDNVNKKVAAIGVKVDQFGFVGALRLPQPIIDSITAKTSAIQKAIQIENELRQTEGEAKKSVARAEGEAKAKIAQAEGEAKAKIAQAEGEAKANELIAKSITPDIIHWRELELQAQAIQKWNGARPSVEGGGNSGLLLQLPTPAK